MLGDILIDMKKLIKNKCEIDGCNITDSNLLELHHIIERTKLLTSNDPSNLAILCCLHHAMLHSGRLEIIGVYPSTKLPNKRVLVYKMDGESNIDIDRPYIESKPRVQKINLK